MREDPKPSAAVIDDPEVRRHVRFIRASRIYEDTTEREQAVAWTAAYVASVYTLRSYSN